MNLRSLVYFAQTNVLGPLVQLVPVNACTGSEQARIGLVRKLVSAQLHRLDALNFFFIHLYFLRFDEQETFFHRFP